MNILITGGAGYLGSVLIPKLLIRSHKVRVMDVGYFGLGHLRVYRPSIEFVREDVRRLCTDKKFCLEITKGIDCIIHLAAISNDPSADLYPELTDEINVHSMENLAKVACSKGIKFIFSSSCSVYGKASGEVNEGTRVKPLTVYAASKVKSENILEELASPKWSPLILRNGTLFGYSPRMRFDLVVNIFSLYSTLYNEIKIFGEGLEWRPFLHVSDCARAFVHFAEKPKYQHQVYNIAHENLRVVDIAKTFKQINPNLVVKKVKLPSADDRDYRVSTRRMKEEGFQTRVDIGFGAEEMVEAILSGMIQDPESIYYRNVKWLKELTDIGKKEPKEIVTFMETLTNIHLPYGGK